MSEETQPRCPVCKDHSADENVGARGAVTSGAIALLEQDFDKMRDLHSVLTPYDAHMAITLYALAVYDMCAMLGGGVKEAIKALQIQQEGVREAMAAIAEHPEQYE